MTRVLVLFALTLSASAWAADGGEPLNVGLVYGEHHAFFVEAPVGWTLDNEAGVTDGLHAVFYPDGSSWAAAPAVMYVNTAGRQLEQTLESFIQGDVDQLRKDGRCDAEVTVGPSIETSDKRTASVRYFSGKQCNREAVAYIQEEGLFVIIALSARTDASFDDSRDAFTQLVKSYMFVTKDVRIEQ